MFKFLVLAGVSGSGKSYLAKLLQEQYGEIFYKVQQVTTREKRPSENNNDYLFLTDEEYDEIKDNLVGKTEVNGCRYGSLLDEETASNRIGIIILNEKGLRDFKEHFDDTDFISIGLNRKIEDLEVARENRDEFFLKKERLVLDLCDYVVNLKKDKYCSPEIIKNMCLTHFNNYFDRVELVASEYQCSTTMYRKGTPLTINTLLLEKDTEDFKKSNIISHFEETAPVDFSDNDVAQLTEMNSTGLLIMENLSKNKNIN